MLQGYRINYIDAESGKYKSYETSTESESRAMANFWDACGGEQFGHRIVEVITLLSPVEEGLRIGNI